MSENLGLSPKPPETNIPLPEEALLVHLESNLRDNNIDEISKSTIVNPRELFCWASLAIVEIKTTQLKSPQDLITAYSIARIGYHRGLDTLRANGWRGSGYVKSNIAGNRGFLTCLFLLSYLAGKINENDEEARCSEFLSMVDPTTKIEIENIDDFLFNR
jgi:hypothetical protein